MTKMPYKDNYTPEYRETVTLWAVQRTDGAFFEDDWSDDYDLVVVWTDDLERANIFWNEDRAYSCALGLQSEGYAVQLVRLVAEVRGIKQLGTEPTDK